MTLHGDTRVDNYYWLRDDSRSQPAVLDYLQQENAYGREAMSSQRSLQDRVLKEIIDRIPPKEVSAPYIKTAIAIVRSMNRAASTRFTSARRWAKKPGHY
jgi:protease II